MARSWGVTVGVVVACGPTSAPPLIESVGVGPVAPAPIERRTPSADAAATGSALAVCSPQPPPPDVPIEPRCTSVALAGGGRWHDQLTLQLSSTATTRIDCPRMRFHGRDTPSCVTGVVAGRVRGACCPVGRTDPTDPECVGEGTIDRMYARARRWEWCTREAPSSAPCEPCVWASDDERLF